VENQRFWSFSVNHFITEDTEEKHMVPNMKHVQHEVKPMLTHFNPFQVFYLVSGFNPSEKYESQLEQ
jgi:hypothetical protein